VLVFSDDVNLSTVIVAHTKCVTMSLRGGRSRCPSKAETISAYTEVPA
jgi:hypothetical protein